MTVTLPECQKLGVMDKNTESKKQTSRDFSYAAEVTSEEENIMNKENKNK